MFFTNSIVFKEWIVCFTLQIIESTSFKHLLHKQQMLYNLCILNSCYENNNWIVIICFTNLTAYYKLFKEFEVSSKKVVHKSI